MLVVSLLIAVPASLAGWPATSSPASGPRPAADEPASPLPPASTAPLFGRSTPEVEIITLPDGKGSYATIRAERRDITLWQQALAVMLYSGPLAAGQQEINDGRYSLITVPRNPAEEILFLREHVWPALGGDFMPTGTMRGLRPDEILRADDPRFDILEQNLLRAAWRRRLVEAGLAGSVGLTSRMERSVRTKRFRQQVIEEAERNGFLHEVQHALDEAHRVEPQRFRNPSASRVEAEMRAILAAVAHSKTPHYVLFFAIRQYRQGLEPYDEAVVRLLEAMARVARCGGHQPGVDLEKNFLVQIPRVDEESLRRLAGRTMATLFAEGDARAGYTLDYTGHVLPAGDLRIETLRGTLRPADLPEPEGAGKHPKQPLAFWRLGEDGVISAAVHVYFSPTGVQVAQRDALGLAVSRTGFVAVHLRAPARPGPWRLSVEGGRFEAGETAGESMPLEVVAGDDPPVRLRPAGAEGHFRADVRSEAVRSGILRLVMRRVPGPGPAAFVTALSLAAVGE